MYPEFEIHKKIVVEIRIAQEGDTKMESKKKGEADGGMMVRLAGFQ